MQIFTMNLLVSDPHQGNKHVIINKINVKEKDSRDSINRPSDRVRGCGTAQFGQTRTITHNSQNPAKSRTILKDLRKHLIKSGILLINKIPKNFLGYFQAVYLPKQSRNPSLSSIVRADIKCKAFFRHSAPAWSLVSVRSTFCQFQ